LFGGGVAQLLEALD